MINTSSQAIEELRKSGYVNRSQARYLAVFKLAHPTPLSHLSATEMVLTQHGVKMPARNGRISELEDKGYIRKFDQVKCHVTRKVVNRWLWTGREVPLPRVRVQEHCRHCKGKGFVVRDRYVEQKEMQKELFS